MHCLSCAKKMTAKLNEVPGVAAVQADVPASRLTVGAKPQQTPSPRALWEAIERAGYHSAKLEGPAGTFTAKPQS
jgi:Cu+-exporting ATPase